MPAGSPGDAMRQAEERAQWEAKHRAEVRRLKRDRETLDKQTSALARLPTANERREVRGSHELSSLEACNSCSCHCTGNGLQA